MYYSFSFNGVESSVHKVRIGFLGSSPAEEGTVLSRSLTPVKQKNTNSFYLIADTIEDPLDLEIEIVRDPCTDDNYYLTYTEMKNILGWLTSGENKELVIHLLNDNTDAHLYGSFYEITEKNYGNYHIGYALKFRATSPYVFGTAQTTTVSNARLFTLSIPRYYYANRKYLCPVINVTPKASGDLRISCSLWDEDCEIDDVTSGEIITLDSKNEIFSSNNETSNATLYNRFNYYFPTLQVDRGSSTTSVSITTNINCDMTITYVPLMLPVGIFN